MQLFTSIFDQLDRTLDTYVHQAVEQAVGYIDGPVGTMAGISMIVYGLVLWSGKSDIPISSFIRTAVTMAIVFVLTSSTGNYNTYIGDILHGLPDDFLSIFATESDISGSEGSIGGTLDRYADKAMQGIGIIWSAGGITNLGWSLLALMLMLIFLAFGVAVVIALGLAKIGSSVVVGLGPIMIVGLLFKATQEFFSRWVSYAISFAFLAALAGGILGVLDESMEQYLNLLQSRTKSQIDLNELLAPGVIMTLSAVIFGQLPNMASSVTGGIGLSIGNAAGKLLGGAARKTMWHGGGKQVQAHTDVAHRRRVERSMQGQERRQESIRQLRNRALGRRNAVSAVRGGLGARETANAANAANGSVR